MIGHTVERVAALRGRSRILGDAVGTFALNLGTMVLNFATVLVLARVLGVADFGAYAFALAWAMLLAVPAIFGLTPLIIRTVASSHVSLKWGRLHGIVRSANRATIGASAATVLVGGAVGWLLLRSKPDLLGPFVVALALVPIVALTSVRQAAMQGLGRVVLGRLPETVIRPALFLAAVVSVYVLAADRLGAKEAVSLHLLSAVVAFLLGALFLRRVFPVEARRAKPEYELRSWARSAFALAAVSGIGVLNAYVAVILLGFMLGPAEVGTYSVAARAAALISFFFVAVRYAVAPAVARFYALDEREQLQGLVTRAARATFMLTLPVAAALLIFADVIVRMFGPGFEDAAGVMRILCVGELATVVTGYAGSILLMTGHELQATKGIAAGAIATVILCPLFISMWGAEGAAAATAIGVVLTQGAQAFNVWTVVRIYSPAIGSPPASVPRQ